MNKLEQKVAPSELLEDQIQMTDSKMFYVNLLI